MKMKRIRLVRYGQSEYRAEVVGIEQPQATIHAKTRTHVVLKVPGHRFWVRHGPGETHDYAPAEFQVYAIEAEDDTGMMMVEPVLSFPVRSGQGKEVVG